MGPKVDFREKLKGAKSPCQISIHLKYTGRFLIFVCIYSNTQFFPITSEIVLM